MVASVHDNNMNGIKHEGDDDDDDIYMHKSRNSFADNVNNVINTSDCHIFPSTTNATTGDSETAKETTGQQGVVVFPRPYTTKSSTIDDDHVGTLMFGDTTTDRIIRDDINKVNNKNNVVYGDADLERFHALHVVARAAAVTATAAAAASSSSSSWSYCYDDHNSNTATPADTMLSIDEDESVRTLLLLSRKNQQMKQNNQQIQQEEAVSQEWNDDPTMQSISPSSSTIDDENSMTQHESCYAPCKRNDRKIDIIGESMNTGLVVVDRFSSGVYHKEAEGLSGGREASTTSATTATSAAVSCCPIPNTTTYVTCQEEEEAVLAPCGNDSSAGGQHRRPSSTAYGITKKTNDGSSGSLLIAETAATIDPGKSRGITESSTDLLLSLPPALAKKADEEDKEVDEVLETDNDDIQVDERTEQQEEVAAAGTAVEQDVDAVASAGCRPATGCRVGVVPSEGNGEESCVQPPVVRLVSPTTFPPRMDELSTTTSTSSSSPSLLSSTQFRVASVMLPKRLDEYNSNDGEKKKLLFTPNNFEHDFLRELQEYAIKTIPRECLVGFKVYLVDDNEECYRIVAHGYDIALSMCMKCIKNWMHNVILYHRYDHIYKQGLEIETKIDSAKKLGANLRYMKERNGLILRRIQFDGELVNILGVPAVEADGGSEGEAVAVVISCNGEECKTINDYHRIIKESVKTKSDYTLRLRLSHHTDLSGLNMALVSYGPKCMTPLDVEVNMDADKAIGASLQVRNDILLARTRHRPSGKDESANSELAKLIGHKATDVGKAEILCVDGVLCKSVDHFKTLKMKRKGSRIKIILRLQKEADLSGLDFSNVRLWPTISLQQDGQNVLTPSSLSSSSLDEMAPTRESQSHLDHQSTCEKGPPSSRKLNLNHHHHHSPSSGEGQPFVGRSSGVPKISGVIDKENRTDMSNNVPPHTTVLNLSFSEVTHDNTPTIPEKDSTSPLPHTTTTTAAVDDKEEDHHHDDMFLSVDQWCGDTDCISMPSHDVPMLSDKKELVLSNNEKVWKSSKPTHEERLPSRSLDGTSPADNAKSDDVSTIGHLPSQRQQSIESSKKSTNSISYQYFYQRYNEICRAEYEGSQINIHKVKSAMWKRHKDRYGNCNDDCPCVVDLPFLTETVVMQHLRTNPDWINPNHGRQDGSQPVGLVSNFASRFLPLLREEYPDDGPSDLLKRLLKMWTIHKRHLNFGMTCKDSCECSEGWEMIFRKGDLSHDYNLQAQNSSRDTTQITKSKRRAGEHGYEVSQDSIQSDQSLSLGGMSCPRKKPRQLAACSSCLVAGNHSEDGLSCSESSKASSQDAATINDQKTNDALRGKTGATPFKRKGRENEEDKNDKRSDQIVPIDMSLPRKKQRHSDTPASSQNLAICHQSEVGLTLLEQSNTINAETRGRKEYSVEFQTSMDLGFFCVTDRTHGKGCRIVSVSPNGQARKDSRIQAGTTIVATSGRSGKGQWKLSTHEDLKSRYDNAFTQGNKFILFFINEEIAEQVQHTTTPFNKDWASDGHWRGNARDGWDGRKITPDTKASSEPFRQTQAPEYKPETTKKGSVSRDQSLSSSQTDTTSDLSSDVGSSEWSFFDKMRDLLPPDFKPKPITKSEDSKRDRPSRNRVRFSDSVEERRYLKKSKTTEFEVKISSCSNVAKSPDVILPDCHKHDVEAVSENLVNELVEAIEHKSYVDVIRCLEGGALVKLKERYQIDRLQEAMKATLEAAEKQRTSPSKEMQTVDAKRKDVVMKVYVNGHHLAQASRCLKDWYYYEVELVGIEHLRLTGPWQSTMGSRFEGNVAFREPRVGEAESCKLPRLSVQGSLPYNVRLPKVKHNRVMTAGKYLEIDIHLVTGSDTTSLIKEEISLSSMEQRCLSAPEGEWKEMLIDVASSQLLASACIQLKVRRVGSCTEGKKYVERKLLFGVTEWIKKFNEGLPVDEKDKGKLSADVRVMDNISLLHSAIYLQDERLVEKLLKLGANPTGGSAIGSPLDLAYKMKEKMAFNLSRGLSVSQRDDEPVKQSPEHKERLEKIVAVLREASRRGSFAPVPGPGASKAKDDPSEPVGRDSDECRGKTTPNTTDNSLMLSLGASRGEPQVPNPPPSPRHGDTSERNGDSCSLEEQDSQKSCGNRQPPTPDEPLTPILGTGEGYTERIDKLRQGRYLCTWWESKHRCPHGLGCQFAHVQRPWGKDLDSLWAMVSSMRDPRYSEGSDFLKFVTFEYHGTNVSAAYSSCEPHEYKKPSRAQEIFFAEGGPVVGIACGVSLYRSRIEAEEALRRVLRVSRWGGWNGTVPALTTTCQPASIAVETGQCGPCNQTPTPSNTKSFGKQPITKTPKDDDNSLWYYTNQQAVANQSSPSNVSSSKKSHCLSNHVRYAVQDNENTDQSLSCYANSEPSLSYYTNPSRRTDNTDLSRSSDHRTNKSSKKKSGKNETHSNSDASLSYYTNQSKKSDNAMYANDSASNCTGQPRKDPDSSKNSSSSALLYYTNQSRSDNWSNSSSGASRKNLTENDKSVSISGASLSYYANQSRESKSDSKHSPRYCTSQTKKDPSSTKTSSSEALRYCTNQSRSDVSNSFSSSAQCRSSSPTFCTTRNDSDHLGCVKNDEKRAAVRRVSDDSIGRPPSKAGRPSLGEGEGYTEKLNQLRRGRLLCNWWESNHKCPLGHGCHFVHVQRPWGEQLGSLWTTVSSISGIQDSEDTEFRRFVSFEYHGKLVSAAFSSCEARTQEKPTREQEIFFAEGGCTVGIADGVSLYATRKEALEALKGVMRVSRWACRNGTVPTLLGHERQPGPASDVPWRSSLPFGTVKDGSDHLGCKDKSKSTFVPHEENTATRSPYPVGMSSLVAGEGYTEKLNVLRKGRFLCNWWESTHACPLGLGCHFVHVQRPWGEQLESLYATLPSTASLRESEDSDLRRFMSFEYHGKLVSAAYSSCEPRSQEKPTREQEIFFAEGGSTVGVSDGVSLYTTRKEAQEALKRVVAVSRWAARTGNVPTSHSTGKETKATSNAQVDSFDICSSDETTGSTAASKSYEDESTINVTTDDLWSYHTKCRVSPREEKPIHSQGSQTLHSPYADLGQSPSCYTDILGKEDRVRNCVSFCDGGSYSDMSDPSINYYTDQSRKISNASISSPTIQVRSSYGGNAGNPSLRYYTNQSW